MIQEAKYTSPSGKETSFAWKTTSRKTELKTGVYTFPDKDGAHVQHQGAGAKSFPLACIFTEADCMEKADQFEAMLVERGIGELQHPIYGTVKVVPTESIEREDDTVSNYGESTVTVTFTETITDEEASQLSEVASDSIAEQKDAFIEAAVADFAEGVMTTDITTQAAIVTALDTQTQSIIDSLQAMAMTDKKVAAEWLTTAKEAKDRIATFYAESMKKAGKIENAFFDAVDIARLTLRLINLPSRIAISLSEKLKGYNALASRLISQYKIDPFGIDKIKTAYATANLALTGSCAAIAAGSALTVVENSAKAPAQGSKGSGGAGGGAGAGSSKTASAGGNGSSGPGPSGGSFGSGSGPASGSSRNANKKAGTTSRKEALETASGVLQFLETVTAFQDTKIEKNAFVDATPNAHLALVELVHSSIHLIMNVSFSLPLQRIITLDRDRQAIELCAELYGTTDFIDDFIIQNNFNGNEIVLLPMGKKVSCYV